MDKKKKSSLMGIQDKKKGESSTRRNLSQESEELGAKDERFAHVLKNPIYRGVPKNEKKVDIDKRFQSMFHVSLPYPSTRNFESCILSEIFFIVDFTNVSRIRITLR